MARTVPGVQPPLTVLHMITGLNVGGAEAMLAKLVGHPALADANQRHEILSLMPLGVVGRRLAQAGQTPRSLDMRGRAPGLGTLVRLASVMRQVRPDVVQGWMHHGNLAAYVSRLLIRPRPALLWNVRHSIEDIALENRLTRNILRFEARRSRLPEAIIYNSRASAGQYASLGFEPARGTVIPNGFDCSRFAPSPATRGRLRRRFGIRGNATVVAMVARAHPMKSPETLIEGLRRARATGHDLHLLMVGEGMDTLPPATTAAIREAVPNDRITLAGHCTDVSEWLSGVDILVLPSAWGEGFPNILGEAMACGVPCITTDVGDSAWVVGKVGLVVPPGDPEALAVALCRFDGLGVDGRRLLGHQARARVIAEFSLDRVAAQYAQLYARCGEARAGALRRAA